MQRWKGKLKIMDKNENIAEYVKVWESLRKQRDVPQMCGQELSHNELDLYNEITTMLYKIVWNINKKEEEEG